MALDPRDPYLEGGPFRPETPRDPNRGTVLPDDERGKDPMRGEIVDDLTTTPARPLSHEETKAAEHDAGRPARTYAPAETRVAKPPAPGDARLIEEGLNAPVSADAIAHPGDRSDPSELR